VRSDLYKRNAVRSERQCDDGSWELDVELDLTEVAKLLGGRGVSLVIIARPAANNAWHSRLVRVGRLLECPAAHNRTISPQTILGIMHGLE